MKINKKQKAFINECTEHACNILLLNSYGRIFVWNDNDMTEDGCNKNADISTDLKYKELVINIYPPLFENPQSRQFEIIFHEFCHVITEHQYMIGIHMHQDKLVTRREIEHEREHETSLMEKPFLWLLQDTKKYKEISDFIKGLSRILP